jgi:hypothetical protein
MHAGNSETTCAPFAEEAEKARLSVSIDAPPFPGDSFEVTVQGKKAQAQPRVKT